MSATQLDSPCREYHGTRNGKGYGQMKVDGRIRSVHRWIMELALGRQLVPGEVVMHLCDNPPCFRVSHLRVATQRENIRDAVAKGRHRMGIKPGETNGSAKLTWSIVRAIRSDHATGQFVYRDLASKYNCAETNIGRIVRGETWVE